MESDSRQLFNALSLVIVRGRDHIQPWTASFYEEKNDIILRLNGEYMVAELR
jgi:hypothetical protein